MSVKWRTEQKEIAGIECRTPGDPGNTQNQGVRRKVPSHKPLQQYTVETSGLALRS